MLMYTTTQSSRILERLVMYKVVSRKPYTPAFIIYSMPCVMLAMVVLIIFALVNKSILLAILSLLCLCWGSFVDVFFNFQEYGEIGTEHKKLIFNYKLNSSVMVNSSIKCTINKITKYKIRRKSIVLYGDIVRTQKCRKNKSLNKLVINVDSKDICNSDIINLVIKFSEGDKV